MKTIIQFLVFLSFSFSYAQEHFKFYVEIPNSTIVPTVSYKRNGILGLSFVNNDLNSLFSNYTIYKFEKAFPEARTPILQTVYYLEANSIELKNIIEKSYQMYFPRTEDFKEPQLLYTPNDYLHSGDIFNAKNLDLINVKEAWDYSKSDPSFIVGISDTEIDVNHEDLTGKVTTLYLPSSPHSHGTATASTAAAHTDNGKGIAGVGFNSSILGAYTSVYNLLALSNNGARVVNASWYEGCNDDGSFNGSTSYSQLLINEIHENGTVIVVAAGNGVETGWGPGVTPCADPEKFFFPASYNHVISVSGVGSQDVGYVYPPTGEGLDWRDRVEKIPGNPYFRTQTNSRVDIRASAHGNWAAIVPDSNNGNAIYGPFGGTSSAAPHVSGGVSLMLTANSCLNPEEVGSLLKLTSVKLDTISTNMPYIGKLGAGRMDIGKATKAAWQMNPDNGGEVLLINRDFDRWDFILTNSPEYIRLKNESFTQSANVEFRAKKGITLDKNTFLSPGSGKEHYLYVENTNTCSYFNKSYNPTAIASKKTSNVELPKSSIKLYPNPSNDFINVQTDETVQRIDIYDMSGKIVKTNYSTSKMNVEDLPKGNYLVKIQLGNKDVETIKFTKN